MIELWAFVRFLHLATAVLLVGGFGLPLLVARPAYRRAATVADAFYRIFLRRQLRLVRWCLVTHFITALLWLWLQSLNVGGSSAGILSDLAATLPLLAETQFGRVRVHTQTHTLQLTGTGHSLNIYQAHANKRLLKK